MNIKIFIVLSLLLKNILCYQNIMNLSRVRRYLAFPEGSTYSAVFCLTNLMGVMPGSDIMTMNINWGLIYELPNDTKPLLDIYKPAVKRRNRRDLYGRVEKLLTVMGYNGRSCVLRSLCEAEHKLIYKDDSLAHKILNLIFHFPRDPILDNEPDIHHTYHYASQVGRSNENTIEYPEDIIDKCSETFQCPFSLIDLALGYYSYSSTET